MENQQLNVMIHKNGVGKEGNPQFNVIMVSGEGTSKKRPDFRKLEAKIWYKIPKGATHYGIKNGSLGFFAAADERINSLEMYRSKNNKWIFYKIEPGCTELSLPHFIRAYNSDDGKAGHSYGSVIFR